MKINLTKKPMGPTIIEGFPGFGLVGTIVTEFLIEHLDCELIGEFEHEGLPALTPIHKGKLVKPMAVHYSKKYNIIILHTMLNVKGKEWEFASAINSLTKQLNSKKIICIEGVNTPEAKLENIKSTSNFYYFGDKRLEATGLKQINEMIVVGVTGALMQLNNKVNCIFAETHSALPDSKAAAKVIEILDKYLKLKVDYIPLLKQAQEFENKVKHLLKQSSEAIDKDDKSLSYLG